MFGQETNLDLVLMNIFISIIGDSFKVTQKLNCNQTSCLSISHRHQSEITAKVTTGGALGHMLLRKSPEASYLLQLGLTKFHMDGNYWNMDVDAGKL